MYLLKENGVAAPSRSTPHPLRGRRRGGDILRGLTFAFSEFGIELRRKTLGGRAKVLSHFSGFAPRPIHPRWLFFDKGAVVKRVRWNYVHMIIMCGKE